MHFYLAHLVRISRPLIVSAGLLALIISTGCGSSNWSASQRQTPLSVADVAARAATGASTPPPVLLFVGTGTTSGDVAAVKTILGDLKLSYATATSSQLNSMSETALRAYKLFLMPGGNAITISNSLRRTTTTNLHNAIVNDGLHYLGICAGGFFAGGSGYNYLNLMSNVFDFYEDEYDGIHKTAVQVTGSNGTKLDQYWENGPQLSGWGQIVGKYPDGTTAIAQGKAGKGWVILSGVHPEAPQGWRGGMTFTTSAAVDNAYAKTLVTAALSGTALPHF